MRVVLLLSSKTELGGASGGPGSAEDHTLRAVSSSRQDHGVEIVLHTETPEGIEVVPLTIVYAKIVEQHPAVADLEVIDRTVRHPDNRRADPRPGRERFFRREPAGWVLAVLDFGETPAIIVTVFLADQPPA